MAAEFVVTMDGLSPWQRETISRNFAQTRNIWYGGLERADAMFFRCSIEDVRSPSPVAEMLAALAEGFASGEQVRLQLRSLTAGDQYRLSEAIDQTASRLSRQEVPEFRDLGETLKQLRARLEQHCRLSSDPANRAEHMRLEAAVREKALGRKEEERLTAARRRREERVLPMPGELAHRAADDDPGWSQVPSVGRRA